jgi:capsular polysaccharide export protein
MITPGPDHFLRIPPFPRHRAGALVVAGQGEACDPAELARALVEERVGGAFWAPERDPWTRAHDDAESALVHGLRHGGDCGPAVAERIMAGASPRDPFTGDPMGWIAAVRLLGAWRRQIESNRAIAGVFGIAGWKRATLDAMLWDGTGPVRYRRHVCGLRGGDVALAWVARAGAGLAAELAALGVARGEIEDGLIRSSGLGANCVPPLSVIVDGVGSYIDPSRPSVLENLLARGEFSPELLARAAALRAALVAGGVSKYGVGHGASLPPRSRRRVLVTGQVEDDRAVILGGAGCDNLALLTRARAAEPGAEIIYKPHPDVEAGHRKGAIPDAVALTLADRIERTAPIAALLGEVDAVHVISSLAGFEALLRGCEVVTHGVPFYAGWGLTRDVGPVPDRRGRALTLDALVAGVLIQYPRYLDPITRLPCPVEVLVQRMARGEAAMDGPLVRLRQAQGRLMKLFQR